MKERGKLLTALPVVLVIILIFIPVAQFSGDTRHDDQLYVSLRSSPLYAKNGWQPSHAMIAGPEQAEWDFVMDTFDVGFRASALPVPETSVDFGFLSGAQRDIEEFTVFIPFYLDGGKFEYLTGENILIPSLSLAAIGENWELFVNGNSVARNIYLDENGDIYRFRSMHGVNIPFSNEYLNEGDNAVVIRLLGARTSRWTGLIYTSGDYFLGSNTNISSDFNYLATIIICAAFMFTAMYHLLVFFLSRIDLYNLMFGFLSTIIAVYYFFRLPVIYHLIPNSAHVQRIEYAALYFSVLVAVLFLEIAIIGKLRMHTIVYGSLIMTISVVQIFLPVWFMYDMMSVWRMASVGFLGLVVVCDLVYPKVRDAVRRVGAGESFRMYLRDSFSDITRTESGNIFILALILSGAAIFDLLDAAIFNTGVVLFKFGYLVFVIGMTYVLARKSTNMYADTVQANVSLEEAVRNRTEELEKQIAIAEAASRAKSNFLAKMSHEVRTPMNAVLGMSTIAKNTDDIEVMRNCMAKIDGASAHLLGVINDILDMSKIESGKVELSLTEFDFEKMLTKVVNVQTFRIDEKKQTIFVETDDGIPRKIVSDEQRLAQVITNLLSNAIKFTPDGGHISLTSRVLQSDGGRVKLEIVVTDTGIGISEDQKKKVFRSFEQADESVSRKYGGTGLGLAISKNIVEMMGGAIWLESEPEKGSRFSFTVWVQEADFEPGGVRRHIDAPSLPKGAAADISGIFQGKSLLLVEDVLINQEIVVALLKDTGISITCVENGEDACILMAEKAVLFDIVLMDIHMPVVDGYEATRRIRAFDDDYAKNIPIVAMTASVFMEDMVKCREAGMDDHLGKPIDIDAMMKTIRHYLGCSAGIFTPGLETSGAKW